MNGKLCLILLLKIIKLTNTIQSESIIGFMKLKGIFIKRCCGLYCIKIFKIKKLYSRAATKEKKVRMGKFCLDKYCLF